MAFLAGRVYTFQWETICGQRRTLGWEAQDSFRARS